VAADRAWLVLTEPISTRVLVECGVVAGLQERLGGRLTLVDVTYGGLLEQWRDRLAGLARIEREELMPVRVRGRERWARAADRRLDRWFGYLDRPSATRILPEFQSLREGDVIPIGKGAAFPVRSVQPLRALVLGGEEQGLQWIWEFGLYPLDLRRTRLVSRSRLHVPRTWRWRAFMLVLGPAAFVMTRRMLMGIRTRAEALAAGKPVAAQVA